MVLDVIPVFTQPCVKGPCSQSEHVLYWEHFLKMSAEISPEGELCEVLGRGVSLGL